MIIVLTGPTGSGKSKLAIELAKEIDAAIINADAFQVYKELSIATAKPSEEELFEVPSFLFDFIPLDSSYNVKEYQEDLRSAIATISPFKKNIIIAGGTGLYIRAGLYDYEFPNLPSVDMSKYQSLSDEDLFDLLKQVDPDSSLTIHPHNRVRILRALEIYFSTGTTKSNIIAKQNHEPIYDCLFFGLEKERELNYEIVNKRVDEMFEKGLVEENKYLIDKYGRDRSAFKAIGVKELFPYFDGKITLEEAKETIKKNTRHYIKRQMTFFSHQFKITWIKDKFDIMGRLNG